MKNKKRYVQLSDPQKSQKNQKNYFTNLSAHPLPTVIAPWGQNS